MVRLTGCVFIISATSLLGMNRANTMRNQLNQMRELYKIICMIQNEIRYARAYLGEIFLHIGTYLEEPYRSWFEQMGQKMENRDAERFELLWTESIEKYLSKSEIPLKELERLKSLGVQLGMADVDFQVKIIDVYLCQLKEEIQEIQGGMQTKTRLCHCLGVMSGIFISVLLL